VKLDSMFKKKKKKLQRAKSNQVGGGGGIKEKTLLKLHIRKGKRWKKNDI